MIGKIAITILIVITLSSVFAPLLTDYDPVRIDLDSIKEPPGFSHPLGTDNKGRDILSRILYGGRLSIGIAVTAGVISLCLGLTVGLIAGYFGGRVDTVLMMLVDLILSFPSLLLAIGISVVFPPGIFNVVIAIAAVGWASFARLIRGNVLSLRECAYIDSARAFGCSDARIIANHILPNCLPLSFIVLGLKLGGYLLTESALSFLGLGAQPPVPTWGSMISLNRIYILSAPWMVIFAGLAIFTTAVCFNMLGDTLREKSDLKSQI